MSDHAPAAYRERHAPGHYAAAVSRATARMKELSAACYRGDIERLGLVDACRLFLQRDLGGPGAEITPETARWLREWEEIAEARVTLLPGWRFTVEPRAGDGE